VLLLRFIGATEQSAEAQAAYALGYSELFSFITWTSVGLMGAASAVVGQNLGAGFPARSRQAVRAAARLGLSMAAVIGSLFLLIPTQLFALFGASNAAVLDVGRGLLAFLSVSGLFITVALTYTGGLQGSGDTRSPLFISLLSQFVLPIGYLTVVQQTRQLQPTDVWMAIVMGHALRCALSVYRFERGKWRELEVGVVTR